MALIVSRVLVPDSKLATARGTCPESATSTLGEMLDLGQVEADDLYAAMDWLGERQTKIEKVRKRFGLKRVVFVGDRGMLTSARIREELAPVKGLDWVSALRSEQIRKLAKDDGPLQRSLFDETELAEIEHPDFPGERLIACMNPLLAAERKRKREDLLQATEREFEKIAVATRRKNRPLRGRDKIGLRVGKLQGRFITGWSNECAPTFCSACWPTTWSGTCEGHGLRCSLPRTISSAPPDAESLP